MLDGGRERLDGRWEKLDAGFVLKSIQKTKPTPTARDA